MDARAVKPPADSGESIADPVAWRAATALMGACAGKLHFDEMAVVGRALINRDREIATLRKRVEEMERSAREVTCVWCGHQFVTSLGEQKADMLAHANVCPQHPVAALRSQLDAAREALSDPALLEALAEAEHARWAGWMRYQETAPQEKREDWPRKARMTYWALTDAECESDRIEARKSLAIVRNRLDAALSTTPPPTEGRRDEQP